MTHLANGLLRRYLDEPAAVGDADRTHLSGCPRCLEELGHAGQDRDVVAQALASGDRDGSASTASSWSASDLDQVWVALQRRLEEPEQTMPRHEEPGTVTAATAATRRHGRLIERAVRRPVTAAIAAGLVVLGGTAAAAAADWLPVFRTEEVKPVTISATELTNIDQAIGQVGELTELTGLSDYGEVAAPSGAQPSSVPDAATAAARTGLVVPRVSALPTGVEGSPEYLVLDQQSLEFTFSGAKAAESTRTRGAALPPVPAGLEGTRLRIQGGPGVAAVWEQRSGIPTLVVARGKAPTAATQGASLETVRDYLLSLPGISPGLAAQLRMVTGDGTTLPIPVPSALATSSQTDVNGVRATVVEAKDRTVVGVIWVERGELNVVLGPLSRDEVLAVARGLR
jgi:hypothetical protein